MSIIDRVQARLAQEPHLADTLAAVVREEAGGIISDADVLDVLRRLRHDTTGIGPLEQLLAIDGITDVLVNGPDDVWFDRGHGLERAGISFPDDAAVRRLAVRVLASCGRRLDDAQSFADGRVIRADGANLRVHAMLAPPSEAGTLISLRVLKQSRVSLSGLVATGTFDEEAADLLRAVVAQRRSFLIVGGTGSGKTTLLAAMLADVDKRERIICIEDTAELNPEHPHVLTLVTRAVNTEGQGEITMADLLKQSLRMRPDRIIVGEIRGAEVVELLAALNTGHEGCAGTIHANSLEEVPARLEALAALGGMSRTALHAQAQAANPLVLVMRKVRGRRQLAQIGELGRLDGPPRVLWAREGGDRHDSA